MNVVAHAVYEYVGTNPGETSKAIAAAMTPFCKERGIKPASIQAYLSILKKAGLVKTIKDVRAPRAPETFYEQRKWDDVLYRKAAEPKGIGPMRGKIAPPLRIVRPQGERSLNRPLRGLLDEHGPAEVISAMQRALLHYGITNEAWAASMTEDVTEVFETAFDVIQDTMKLAAK